MGAWRTGPDRGVVMPMTHDLKPGEGPLPELSAEVIARAAEEMMQGLRAKHGRAPTLVEVHAAMVQLTALTMGMLHEEYGRVISSEVPNVEGQHDDDDDSA